MKPGVASKVGPLKPLGRVRLWLGLWCGAIALVVLFSLLPAPQLPQVPPGGDKLEHVLGYFALAVGAVQLFVTRHAMRAGLGLIALGIALEIAQGALTTTRSMELRDALADTLGVLAGMSSVWMPWRNALLHMDPVREGAAQASTE